MSTPEGLARARHLQRAAFFGRAAGTRPHAAGNKKAAALAESSSAAQTCAAAENGEPQPISIWHPQQADGELVFVRPDPLPLGDHYSATTTLKARKDPPTRRICFFGESAAAGYLYAPHLTPARVLQDQLRALAGEDQYEVIDLARTNEGLPTLLRTVKSSMQLDPDVLVIFTGNNWTLLNTPFATPYSPSIKERQLFALALGEGGFPRVHQLAAAGLRQVVTNAFRRIARIARTAEIPVVVVIPEINLADWETRQPVAWLPGDQTARWHELYRQARLLLENHEWTRAAETAREMSGLDQGNCPTSHRILALAHLGAGELEKARRAAQAEVDSNQKATLCFLSAPQITSQSKQLQRELAGQLDFACVDLPRIFAEHTGSPLPGRRMFLDYCHLSVEAMKVAMAAVTAEILKMPGAAPARGVSNGGRPLEWKTLLERLPDPAVAPEADAAAKFGAAIHNAHRLLTVGPKARVIEYWCEEALKASPRVDEAMLDFVSARAAELPAVLTAAQQRNYASPCRLTFQAGWQYDYLDAGVIQAIEAVLSRSGSASCEQIRSILLERQSLPKEGRDLVDPPFLLAEPLERFYPEVLKFDDLTERATHRSPWPASRFLLICIGEEEVELTITARLPPAGGPGEGSAGQGRVLGQVGQVPGQVLVTVNNETTGSISLGVTWSRQVIRVDSGLLKQGINTITLHWPQPTVSGEEALERVIQQLELGWEADLHPVFGEIYSLVAKPTD